MTPAWRGRLKRLVLATAGESLASWAHAFRLSWLALKERREPEMSLVPGLLRAGDVAIDVGANGADWTWVLARQVGAAGYVFAFEADPYYASVTAKTIRILRLNNVRFFPIGLSDRNETVRLLIKDQDHSRLSGSGRIVRGADPEFEARSVAVKVARLDDIAASEPQLQRTRLIKCDVEGFELMVLRGACSLLQRARPIVIAEVGHAGLHGHSDAELHEFLGTQNYAAFRFQYGRLVPHAQARTDKPYYNCVFVPVEQLDDTVLRRHMAAAGSV